MAAEENLRANVIRILHRIRDVTSAIAVQIPPDRSRAIKLRRPATQSLLVNHLLVSMQCDPPPIAICVYLGFQHLPIGLYPRAGNLSCRSKA